MLIQKWIEAHDASKIMLERASEEISVIQVLNFLLNSIFFKLIIHLEQT